MRAVDPAVDADRLGADVAVADALHREARMAFVERGGDVFLDAFGRAPAHDETGARTMHVVDALTAGSTKAKRSRRLPSASRSVSLGANSVSGSKRVALPRQQPAAQRRVDLDRHRAVAELQRRLLGQCKSAGTHLETGTRDRAGQELEHGAPASAWRAALRHCDLLSGLDSSPGMLAHPFPARQTVAPGRGAAEHVRLA